MCGIAGIVALRPDTSAPAPDTLARMASALSHRGPDSAGVYRDARAGLAHARLAIIDVASGQQPMSAGDEDTWLVYNGELFNYLELRDELIAAGCRFKTRSDTEVVLHAYRTWGEAAFTRFNGQWALGLWQPARGALVLSRDPLGICPLYYAEHAGRVVFASEVKALFVGEPDLPRAFDPVGLQQVLTFWTSVAPQTVFRGVRELEPGNVRIYQHGSVAQRAYWQPRFPTAAAPGFAGGIDDAASALREALETATRLRLERADVPVGCYLSGGLDSATVAALAKRARPEGLHTFSLRFADVELDETPFQDELVRHLGSTHHALVCSRAMIAEVFPRAVTLAERPLLRTAPAPLLLLSQLAAEHGVKVVLTGEGADELLAGYDLFREAKIRRFWARQPESRSRPRLLERLYPYLTRSPTAAAALSQQFFGRGLALADAPTFAHMLRWQSAAALQRLLRPEQRAPGDRVAELVATFPPEFGEWSALARDQYVELRTLLSGYLLSAQGDRMLLGSSVEGRFPFLDDAVIALCNSLPDRYKLRGLDEKHVLKRLAQALVPPAVTRRSKQPYRAPDALSFVHATRPAWIDALMGEDALRASEVFIVEPTRALWRKCLGHNPAAPLANADNMALVFVLSTQLVWQGLLQAAPSAAAQRHVTVVTR